MLDESYFRSPEFRITMLELIVTELLDRIDATDVKLTELIDKLNSQEHQDRCNGIDRYTNTYASDYDKGLTLLK